MEYRFLGRSGLKVSALSLGAWVTYGGQVGEEIAYECMQAAYEAGVNFFDNAEAYSRGNAEIVMGNVIRKLGGSVRTWLFQPRYFGAVRVLMIMDFRASTSWKVWIRP